MRVELLGAINYDKLASYMDKRVEGIVRDNNSMLDYITLLSNNNLCTEENVSLIDDVINYLSISDTETMSSYVEALKNIKESFYKSREDLRDAVGWFKKIITEQNEYLANLKNDAVAAVKQLEKDRRSAVVAAAGQLSHFHGKVFEFLEKIEGNSLEKNARVAANICELGHNSITDHDYCLFAVEDISVMMEQILIEERYSSFTIKSRREVNFADAGFYVNDFHDVDGNIIKDNEKAKQEFIDHINWLFGRYSFFIENGVAKEDARFVLPYNFNSNFFMGFDAHVLKDVIIKFTKTRFSLIQEAREFGEKLYEIAKEHIPYIIPEIDATPVNLNDDVRNYILDNIGNNEYEIIDKPKLISASSNIDDTILTSAIMRKTQLPYKEARKVYKRVSSDNTEFRTKLMELLFKNGDANELAQVGFVFQIPISYAVLTHYTRHRTHPILIPEFAPNVDLYKFKIPPAIDANPELRDKFVDVFTMNDYQHGRFRDIYGIREEDLVYFTLSGNMVNIVTRLDGKTMKHISSLRECTRAQWESRNIARGLHDEVGKVKGAELFSSNLGPLCETHGICKEGKKSCGKVLALQKKKETEEESN